MDRFLRDLDQVTSHVFRDGKLYLALPMDAGIHAFAPPPSPRRQRRPLRVGPSGGSWKQGAGAVTSVARRRGREGRTRAQAVGVASRAPSVGSSTVGSATVR